MKIKNVISAAFILFSLLQIIGCDNENLVINPPKTEEKIKAITFNLGLGANRCFGEEIASFCARSCDLDCNSQDTICVKPLLKTEESLEKIAKFLSNQFEENELGIICLQEVNTDISGINILDLILSEFDSTWNATFFSPSNTTFGIATLSNLEFREERFWNLLVNAGNEKRGAIALKLQLESKSTWIVNTHLGTNPSEQIDQVEELKNRYLTFDTIVPVLICGDLNIVDIEDSDDNPITIDQLLHYEKTIQKLIETGIEKVKFAPSELNKFSFPSWTSPTFRRTIDYFFWLDRKGGIVPEMNTLRPGFYSTSSTNAVCPDFQKNDRFLSDHNGLMIRHSIFE